MRTERSRFALQETVTKAANYTLDPVDQNLGRFKQLIITLSITAAELDTGNETYDFYISTQGQNGEAWDLIHFPQIAATGAKTFIARVWANVLPQQVTTAAPGVASVESGSMAIASGQANVLKSLGEGVVRHGPWGDKIGYALVVAGTIVTGISYSITVEGR